MNYMWLFPTEWSSLGFSSCFFLLPPYYSSKSIFVPYLEIAVSTQDYKSEETQGCFRSPHSFMYLPCIACLLCARHCTSYLFNSHDNLMKQALPLPFIYYLPPLYIQGKLRHREVKPCAQYHTASKQQDWKEKSGLSDLKAQSLNHYAYVSPATRPQRRQQSPHNGDSSCHKAHAPVLVGRAACVKQAR